MSNDLNLRGLIKQKAVLAGEIKKKAVLAGEIKTPVMKKGLQFEIELSTDIEKPTELTDFTNSGIYVAKNEGILALEGQPLTILAKGMFFKVFNLKDSYEVAGMELPDEENMILIQVMSIEGYYDHVLVKQGMNDWITDNVTLNSLNINDYINIDTSDLLSKSSNINYNYGINLVNNYLAIKQASNQEIEAGNNQYRAITPFNIAYAVQKKGEKYFTKITDFNKLNSDVNTLKSEIEQILDTVVNINE